MQDLVARFALDDDLAPFAHFDVLSLEYPEDADNRLVTILESLIPEVTIRPREAMLLDDIINEFKITWATFLTVVSEKIRVTPSDMHIVAMALRSGVDIINQAGQGIKAAMSKHGTVPTKPLDLIRLPVILSSKPVDEAHLLVSQTLEGLKHPPYAEISEVSCILGPLAQAANRNERLPIADLLDAIAVFIFERLSPEPIELRSWRGDMSTLSSRLFESATTTYSQYVNQRIDALLDTSSQPRPFTSPPTTLSAQFTANGDSDFPALSHRDRPLKRPRADENTPPKPESKATKNARLLRAMADVQTTLAEIEAENVDLMV